MSAKLIKCYLYSAGIVLLISGLAKVISGSGNAKILGTPDPIFNVSFRYMFTIVGALEIGIGKPGLAGNCPNLAQHEFFSLPHRAFVGRLSPALSLLGRFVGRASYFTLRGGQCYEIGFGLFAAWKLRHIVLASSAKEDNPASEGPLGT